MAVWDNFDFLVRRFRQETLGRTFTTLPPDTTRAKPIQEGKAYFRVWVRQMFLARERDWFHGQYPTVQSFLTFNFGGGNDPVTIAHAAGPNHLTSVDKNHVNRVISVNHLLCELVPFIGGSVKMEIALIAAKIDDDIERFLNVMGTFSQLVSVPQLSLALNMTPKVADGVRELAGVTDNKLVTGFVGTFVGAGDGNSSDEDRRLRNTQFVVADLPMNDVDSEQLSFQNNRLLFNGKPLEGANWMVVEIETVPSRKNIVGTIPAINVPLRKATDALQNAGRKTAADALVKSAIVAALNSDDLIQRDRDAAVKDIKKQYERAKAATNLATGPKPRRATARKPKGQAAPPIAQLETRALQEKLRF